jgi:enoyl-CoA hydratase
MAQDVRIQTHGLTGHLSLNRPQAIHALTHAICTAMSAALSAWAADDTIKAVIVDHAEGRGFCAGGDIALLRNSALNDDGISGRAFFRAEYCLNHQMFSYDKPIVAFMDGITMGGGVGISQPAQYRVATENTRFAMPETGIGLFPDVGGGWYLSRLKHRIGQFLALTGARFDGAECLWAGLATHYLPSEALAEAKARIIANPNGIADILADLSVPPPEARIACNAALITHHFASDTLEDILASLAGDDNAWAAKELATLSTKSPQSCKVSLRQLRESAQLGSFAENMQLEFRLASRVLTLPDFAEGVRAVITDKTGDPKWSPGTPEAVTPAMLDAIFAPLPKDQEWTPL